MLSPTGVFANNNVLVLGDSLSAAYGIEPQQGWVSLLQQRWQQQARPYQLVNASVSGETTYGGLRRLDGLLKRYQPHAVIIELGGNDGLRGLPLSQTKTNLEKMVSAIRQQKAQIYLLSMRLPPNYGPRYNQRFENMYQDVAKQFDIPLKPFFPDNMAEDLSHFQADGIHPTASAQRQLTDYFEGIFSRWLFMDAN